MFMLAPGSNEYSGLISLFLHFSANFSFFVFSPINIVELIILKEESALTRDQLA